MDISLKSQSDILAWASLFRILGFELSKPIWEIIDIPKEIINKTENILEIAKYFFSRGGDITSKKRMTSEDEILNHFEALRMIDLGHLYISFGRIVASYKEENAIKLYKWGERHFIHEKANSLKIWYSVFLNVLRNKVSVETPLAEPDFKQVLDIAKNQFEQTAHKKENLKIEFEKMCQKYTLEDRNLLNDFLSYDLTSEHSFDNVKDELDFVFNFDLLLSQDCAYRIWHLINETLERNIRENLFQWGINVSLSLGINLDKDLEEYYLTL